MFEEPTVFVLGAGASWHYGYPTGEKLITLIRRYAHELLEDIEKMSRFGNVYVLDYSLDENGMKREDVARTDPSFLWNELRNQCQDLIKRLNTINPLVIDYFLGQNKHLQSIGRLLIGAALVAAEALQPPSWKAPREDNNDWYRFISYKLCENCAVSSDLLKNSVTFVTFNYDITLDNYLEALSSTALFDAKDVQAFLIGDRILHVYGSLEAETAVPRTPDAINESLIEPETTQARDAFVRWHKRHWRSKQIRVIDPHDKTSNEQAIQIAMQRIKEAKNIYILGYGFDENNNGRIGLDAQNLAQQAIPLLRRIYFTNYCDSARINKRAGRLFEGNETFFLQQGHVVKGGKNLKEIYEKSIRNVYDALAVDFDL